jgi:hypothetical protein
VLTLKGRDGTVVTPNKLNLETKNSKKVKAYFTPNSLKSNTCYVLSLNKSALASVNE